MERSPKNQQKYSTRNNKRNNDNTSQIRRGNTKNFQNLPDLKWINKQIGMMGKKGK